MIITIKQRKFQEKIIDYWHNYGYFKMPDEKEIEEEIKKEIEDNEEIIINTNDDITNNILSEEYSDSEEIYSDLSDE